MRVARVSTCLILAFSCICLQAQPPQQKITVTGKLGRVLAIGAESTGWAIQLESKTAIEGPPLDAIQISYHDTAKLEKLANKRVRASGILAHRHGVETGEQPILEVSSIKEVRAARPAPAQTVPFSLSKSEWLLEDLGAARVIDNVQATLTFPEAGKVAGNGSCNRFFAPVEINGNAIKLGPLGSSRMACPEAVMNQETKYLNALQAAERFEWKDPYLLIHCQGFAEPLRFTRMPAAKPATP